MAEADDEAHLDFASANHLALITKDAGFRIRHFQWINLGKITLVYSFVQTVNILPSEK